MKKYIKNTKQTTVIYDANDIEKIYATKKLFNYSYKKAKRDLKANPKNYNAKVDVCFYRILFKKLNIMLAIIERKGKYIEKPIIEVKRSIEVHSTKQ